MPINSDFLIYLKPEELGVEFLVRGLSPQNDGDDTVLKEILLNEQNKISKPPQKSHCSTSEIECNLIKQASSVFSNFALESAKDVSILDLQIYLARIAHYMDRAVRVKLTFGEVSDITNNYNRLNRAAKSIKEVLREKSKPQTSSTEQTQPTISVSKTTISDSANLTSTRTGVIPKNTSSSGSNIQDNSLDKSTQRRLSFQNAKNSRENGMSSRESQRSPKSSNETFPSIQNINENSSIYVNAFGTDVTEVYPPLPNANLNGCRDQDNFEDNEANFDARARNFGNFDNFKKPKWDLKFDGSNKDLDVNEFVFRLETLATKSKLPLRALESFIFNFVSGSAEKWLWVYTRNYPDADWFEMRESLLSRFGNLDSDRANRRRVESRYQKRDETFSDFALEIESLNSHLRSPFSERDLIEILRENMSDELQNATLLLRFRSIEHLRTTCAKFEKQWFQKRRFPFNHNYLTNRRISELDHSFRGTPLAYISESTPQKIDEPFSVQSKLFSNNSSVGQFKAQNNMFPISKQLSPESEENLETDFGNLSILNQNEPEVINRLAAVSDPAGNCQNNDYRKMEKICFNCKDIGHFYVDCPIPPQHIFCYGCGRENILKPNCFACQRKLTGNFKTGVNQTGVSRPIFSSNPLKTPILNQNQKPPQPRS